MSSSFPTSHSCELEDTNLIHGVSVEWRNSNGFCLTERRANFEKMCSIPGDGKASICVTYVMDVTGRGELGHKNGLPISLINIFPFAVTS